MTDIRTLLLIDNNPAHANVFTEAAFNSSDGPFKGEWVTTLAEGRQLMHEAALSVTEDPDRLSFLHAVRVVRRKLAVWDAISPYGEKKLPPRDS